MVGTVPVGGDAPISVHAGVFVAVGWDGGVERAYDQVAHHGSVAIDVESCRVLRAHLVQVLIIDHLQFLALRCLSRDACGAVVTPVRGAI